MKKLLFLLILLPLEVLAQRPVISFIGDSYVANHRRPKTEAWHSLLAEELQMDYQNVGRNGGCVAFDRTRDGFGPSMMVRYKQLDPKAEYVVIIAGHNDAVKIGENRDSLQMFSDSLDVLLNLIHQQCPRARIGYVTPWYVDKPGFDPVCKTIRKVCRRHHVPVLYNYSPKCIIKVRDDDFRARYFQGKNDTAHLNAEGHRLFLPVARKWFEKKLARK